MGHPQDDRAAILRAKPIPLSPPLQGEVAEEAPRIRRCAFTFSKINFGPDYGIGSLQEGGGSRFDRCQRDRRLYGRLLRYGRKHGQRVRVAPSLAGVDHLVPC